MTQRLHVIDAIANVTLPRMESSREREFKRERERERVQEFKREDVPR